MNKRLLFILILFSPACIFAQVLFVSPGSSVFVEEFQTVSFDSLSMRPTAAFTISGPNALYRNPSITNFAPQATIGRVLKFDSPVTGFSGKISFFYRDSELATLAESDLVLSNYNGTIWRSFNTGISRNSTTNEVTVIGITNIDLGELTLSSRLNPLPLLWQSVSAIAGVQSNVITWSTTDEASCNYFVVERSLNGTDWEPCSGYIPALNTTGPNRYSWNDLRYTSGKYYRIRLVNIDNSSTYSRTVTVNRDQLHTIQIYPNPVQGKLSVTSTDPLLKISQVRIHTMAGSAVETISTLNGRSATVTVDGLARGTYMLTTTFNNGQQQTNIFQKN